LSKITKYFICVIAAIAYSLQLLKQHKLKQANKLNMMIARALLVLYVGLNIYFISQAFRG
jgi:hypothetical protein